MARHKDIDTRRKILQLYNEGIHSPSEIAKRMGLPASKVRLLMHRMRKEGLLPKINPTTDLLDGAIDAVKAALFRTAYVHAEMVARNDKLAKPLAEAQELLQRALEYIVTFRKMKQLEGER